MFDSPTVTEVLAFVAEQSRSASPTLVSIGVTENHFVHNNVVVIKEACPKVAKAVVNQWPFTSLTADGLRVTCKEA